MPQQNESIKEKLASLPTNPGCYLYKDRFHKVIYVGKAKNLKRRVLQYFTQGTVHSPRIERMITQINDIEYHIVNSELEALVLEANLIKKYHPPYNVLMKDDKSYTWIKITTKEEYPRILRIRDQDKRNDGNVYFGPYPNASSVRNILTMLRHLFKFRTCSYEISQNKTITRSRLCLYYYIGLCSGPCDHMITRAVYRKQIYQIIHFLKGDTKGIVDDYKKQMLVYAKQEEFEKAKLMRDKINDILYVTQKIALDTKTDEQLLEKTRTRLNSNAIFELFSNVHAKNEHNARIECYDISNIQGTNPVGAMVVFENGIAKKSDYRKFKIRSLQTPNDFAMMQEMLTRRLTHLHDSEKKDTSFQSIPDLIIIDGGKGQLSSACEVLAQFHLTIPIVGLAKREELLFFPDNPTPLRLRRTSEALYLVQRIRDEAHRFGITFHRKLRSQQSFITPLDTIKGIGEKTKIKLLKAFKSFDHIREASDEELLKTINKKVLKAIRAYPA